MRILEKYVNDILNPKPARKAPSKFDVINFCFHSYKKNNLFLITVIRNGKPIDKKTTVKKVNQVLESEKVQLETKLADVEDKLGMKKKLPPPKPASSSSSSSSSDSDSSSSGSSSSDSDDD